MKGPISIRLFVGVIPSLLILTLMGCGRNPDYTGIYVGSTDQGSLVMKQCTPETKLKYDNSGRLTSCRVDQIECTGRTITYVTEALVVLLKEHKGKEITIRDKDGNHFYESFVRDGSKEDPCAEAAWRRSSAGLRWHTDGTLSLDNQAAGGGIP